MLFVSEDGSQRMSIDLTKLPVCHQIRTELAIAVEAATGPTGPWKRLGTAKNILRIAQRIAHWIAATRPELETLEDLTRADGRMLAQSITDDRQLGQTRTLLTMCAQVSAAVMDGFAMHHIQRSRSAREPYTDAEFERICVAARGIARQARTRIRKHRILIADLRAGRLDHLDHNDQKRKVAVVLDHCDRNGDLPRSPVTGAPGALAREAALGLGRGHPGLMSLIHVTSGEAWAFGVLLAALAGLNASVIDSLPARHLLATASGELPVALVQTNKPRRGASAKVTLPLTQDASDATETSLTSPLGVYSTLIELTEPARIILGSESAFAYYAGVRNRENGSMFRTGLPAHQSRAKTWTAAWHTGDVILDTALCQVSMDRLRKTRIEKSRIPILQSRSMHDHYLQRMHKVREEGFGIVREALDDQVARAIASRRMTVDPTPVESAAPISSQDTILGECDDFQHSPFDNGRPCQQPFLTCLDCVNARAFPRHLPTQLLVADRLRQLQNELPAEIWIRRYAGALAQLDDIFTEYTSAQIAHARSGITNRHHVLVDHLLQGDLDPT
ncbi:hypothetical protein [Prescottella agglutinans]|uniref:hypothetical protein n=1 Tax=Prescottella agglutinans TaxID=1644129 RepID=UPI003D9713A2